MPKTSDIVKRMEAMKMGKSKEEIDTFLSQTNGNPSPEIQLDLFNNQDNENLAAMPNTFARSALFAPIARGKRKYHNLTKLSSRSDITIKYTGVQLDMGDSDVFMQIIKIARTFPLGSRVEMSRYKCLKEIGRHTGKGDYAWLALSIHRIKSANMFISTKARPAREISLLEEYDLDIKTNKYYLRLNPKIITMFNKEQYGLIDWDKRKSFTKRVDLAKWLQLYIASNKKGNQFISVEKIKLWCAYNSPTRHFKTALKEALDELERLEIVKIPVISKSNQITYKRL